jgi:ElaB/YqjD/DUF883 family membrane-anchored ribosome-binding protein
MAWYSGLSDLVETARVSDELSSLRKELALIQRKLRRSGKAGWQAAEEQGSDFYEDLRDRLSDALPVVQRQAQVAGRFARDNRAAVIVGTAAVVGLLVVLAARRR